MVLSIIMYNIAEVKIYCFCMCMQGMKGAAGKPGVKGFKGVAVSCCNECVYIYTHLAKGVTIKTVYSIKLSCWFSWCSSGVDWVTRGTWKSRAPGELDGN